MDPSILKQLGINSDLKGNDAELLQQVMGALSSGKKLKMTPQQRNQLMAQLSNQQSNEYVQTKDLEDMTPEEREEHRQMLRKKLREKTNSMAQMRQGKSTLQKSLANAQKSNSPNPMNNLNDMLKNLNLEQLQKHAEEIAKASGSTSGPTSGSSSESTPASKPEESLDDYLN